jgi:murein endopeptidase
MSYARWSEGDVYVFSHVDGGIMCMSCSLMPEEDGCHSSFTCRFPEEMLKHLQEHKDAGHSVPDSAMKRLEKEAIEEGGMVVMKVTT